MKIDVCDCENDRKSVQGMEKKKRKAKNVNYSLSCKR